MLSVKQGGIKYYFLSFWYYVTWDWTPVSWAIGEHSTTKPMGNCATTDVMDEKKILTFLYLQSKVKIRICIPGLIFRCGYFYYIW